MRTRRVLAASGIAAIAALVATALIVVPALATPASGETPRLLAPVGHFDEIKAKAKMGDWEAKIRTKGVTDVHVVEVTIQPGGYLGWHSHLGPRFLIVKSGAATNYTGDDPACTPEVIPARSESASEGGELPLLKQGMSTEWAVAMPGAAHSLCYAGVAPTVGLPHEQG